VQIKKSFAQDASFFDNPNNISTFSKTYALPEELIRKYVDHLKGLELRRGKRAKETIRQADLESKKTYDDYNWTEMFLDGSLKRLKNAVLDKYIIYHTLGKCSNKKAKLEVITKKITQELSQQVDEDEEVVDSESEEVEESENSEDEQDDEFILAEIGISDEEDDSNEEVEGNAEVYHVYTRSGRRATRLRLF
jgi:hypothetical protein